MIRRVYLWFVGPHFQPWQAAWTLGTMVGCWAVGVIIQYLGGR